MLEKVLTKIFNYLKSEKFRTNIIILFSVITINFAAYIAFFDLNSLSIVDSSTISRHMINILIPYVLVSICVTLIIHIISMDFGLSRVYEVFRYGLKEERFGKIVKLTMDYFNGSIFKYIIIFFLFSLLYIGKNITLGIFLVFIVIILILIISYFLYSVLTKFIIKNMIKNINNEKDKVELQKIYNKNINYKNMLINNLGIIIILLSFILGIARAQHVQNTMFVTINNNDSNYILYMTTIAGIGLYDSKLKQASFKSWDTITDLKFNIKNKNSIETFLDSFRDYINKFSHLD